jgi:molybdenum cofactor cytidylyltransferase
MRAPILILAAGASTRMRGRDKMLQNTGEGPLLRRQVQMALATDHPVFVALPAQNLPRGEGIADLPATILPVKDAAQGQGASLRNAVAQLPDCAAFMVLLGDLLTLTTADLQKVFAAQDDQNLIWRGATQDGKAGGPVLFSARLRPAFAHLAGDEGGAPIIRAHQAQTKLIPLPGNRARFDLDTPEEWAAYQAAIARATP